LTKWIIIFLILISGWNSAVTFALLECLQMEVAFFPIRVLLIPNESEVIELLPTNGW